jgi:hypothetical protein
MDDTDQPFITDEHVARCRKLAQDPTPPPGFAAFWAGAVLIDEKRAPSEHDVAQLAQMAFPRVDSLSIARSVAPVMEAIAIIRGARDRMAARRQAKQETPEP